MRYCCIVLFAVLFVKNSNAVRCRDIAWGRGLLDRNNKAIPSTVRETRFPDPFHPPPHDTIEGQPAWEVWSKERCKQTPKSPLEFQGCHVRFQWPGDTRAPIVSNDPLDARVTRLDWNTEPGNVGNTIDNYHSSKENSQLWFGFSHYAWLYAGIILHNNDMHGDYPFTSQSKLNNPNTVVSIILPRSAGQTEGGTTYGVTYVGPNNHDTQNAKRVAAHGINGRLKNTDYAYSSQFEAQLGLEAAAAAYRERDTEERKKLLAKAFFLAQNHDDTECIVFDLRDFKYFAGLSQEPAKREDYDFNPLFE